MSIVDLNDAPRKARDTYNKALSAFERRNYDYAMDLFTTVLEIEPGLLQARKFLRAAAVGKLKDKGINALTHSLSSLKGMGKSMSVSGLLKKKPERALIEAEKLMRIDPLNKQFIKVFCQAAVAADMPEAAIQTLEIAKEHYPSDLEVLKRLADLYMAVEHAQKGRKVYEEICQLKPNDQKALKDMKDAAAIATMQKGGWEEAESYRDLIKDTKQATTLEQQGKSVKSDRDIVDLIEESKRKIEREPENVNYRRHLADLYIKSNEFDQAYETLQEALKVTGSTDPLIERAMSDIVVAKFNHELATLEAQGETDAAHAKRLEKKTYMLKDAAARVANYPNDLQYKFDFGSLLYENGNLNEAIQQFQLAQRNPQRRIRSLYFLGMCFKDKEQYDMATDQLDKACSEMSTMDNEKKDIVYELGQVYELQGNMEEAIKKYKEIYSVDIGFKDISTKIEQGYGG